MCVHYVYKKTGKCQGKRILSDIFLFAGIFSRQFEKNNPVNARFLSSGTGNPLHFGQLPVHMFHTRYILYFEILYPYRVSIWCIRSAHLSPAPGHDRLPGCKAGLHIDQALVAAAAENMLFGEQILYKRTVYQDIDMPDRPFSRAASARTITAEGCRRGSPPESVMPSR